MITFDGKDVPNFVVVRKVDIPILPPISQNTSKVSGRAGSISFGNEIDVREIEVEVSLIANDKGDLRVKSRQFAEWLYCDEPKRLIIKSDPNIYYMAQLTDSTDMNEMQDVGQGTIKFICNDPHGYSIDEIATPLNPIYANEQTTVVNQGQLTAYPRMEFVFSKPTTNFNIVTRDEVMTFGKADTDKIVKDINPVIFSDNMDSGVGWATANYIDSGIITGNAFTSNGWSLSVPGRDFGTGTSWHGPAGVKSLGSQLTDFRASCVVGMYPEAVGELGRVQIYGLDINGNTIFIASMRQGHPNKIAPYAEVKIGNKYYIQTYGAYQGAFHPFVYGKMVVARRGNSWSIYYAVTGDKGKGTDHTQMYKEFKVHEGGYDKNKLAQIQIHIGTHGEATPASMWIGQLNVEDLSPILNSNEIPIIFKAGDRLVVDSSNDSVFLNGEPYYESIDPSSQFPVLEKGPNGVILSPQVTASGSMRFRERFW